MSQHRRARLSLREIMDSLPCTSCQLGYDREHVCDVPEYCRCDRTEMHVEAVAFDEGDEVLLKAKVARANREQAFIEFVSMEGPYSIRVPLSELQHVKKEVTT